MPRLIITIDVENIVGSPIDTTLVDPHEVAENALDYDWMLTQESKRISCVAAEWAP